jgi:hypothetical protein
MTAFSGATVPTLPGAFYARRIPNPANRAARNRSLRRLRSASGPQRPERRGCRRDLDSQPDCAGRGLDGCSLNDVRPVGAGRRLNDASILNLGTAPQVFARHRVMRPWIAGVSDVGIRPAVKRHQFVTQNMGTANYVDDGLPNGGADVGIENGCHFQLQPQFPRRGGIIDPMTRSMVDNNV